MELSSLIIVRWPQTRQGDPGNKAIIEFSAIKGMLSNCAITARTILSAKFVHDIGAPEVPSGP